MVHFTLYRITYVEQKYGKKIELSEDNVQNYNSVKNVHRRSSVTKIMEALNNVT